MKGLVDSGFGFWRLNPDYGLRLMVIMFVGGTTMEVQPLEFEGTWEEIAAYAPKLAGRKVRITVLTTESSDAPRGHFASDAESSTSFCEGATATEIFACQGIQPVANLATFLESLPDFGQDAIHLWEAIAEDRAQRRALAGEVDC